MVVVCLCRKGDNERRVNRPGARAWISAWMRSLIGLGGVFGDAAKSAGNSSASRAAHSAGDSSGAARAVSLDAAGSPATGSTVTAGAPSADVEVGAAGAAGGVGAEADSGTGVSDTAAIGKCGAALSPPDAEMKNAGRKARRATARERAGRW